MSRISVPCSEELYARLQKICPWGTQAALIRRVVELTVDKIEKDGYNIVQLLISGRYNPLEANPTKKENQDEVRRS